MKTIRQILAHFQDSPTYGRDRANLITGFSVGTTSLLLNGAVLMLVLPLLASPDYHVYRKFTDNMEFGQLLGVILLGGATAFATLLIPLRLLTVFWEPRVSRYFDQIVLSGISPLRFVIGKATSQNLFLGLILFLLLPYLVLSLTLGGINFGYFAAGLLLVWLYCMELALVTLWLSLYINELLAAAFVIALAWLFAYLGCIQMTFQPFVMTPFPALIFPVFSSDPIWREFHRTDFFTVFAACAGCMGSLICMSLIAIYLGPLYGIIRENSTFGEVVRVGDSKRKRWFRMRMHIQRSSEISFFYNNRSRAFLRNEGVFRWGIGFGGLLSLGFALHFALFYFMSNRLPSISQIPMPVQVFSFHSSYLSIHGLSLAIAVLLFSHAKNTTYLRLPFFRGRTAEVSRLDTISFLFFALISTATSIATPFAYERYIAVPNGISIFPDHIDAPWLQGRQIDFVRIAIEGSMIILVGGLVFYAFQRLTCLSTWVRSVTFLVISAVYSFFICGLPIALALMVLEVPELRGVPLLANWAPTLAATSPSMAMIILFNGEMGSPFPKDVSTTPFYVMHGVFLCLMILAIRRSGRKLRRMYLAESVRETRNG